MSRIGKMPIEVPSGVEVTVEGTLATVKGPKGTLSETIPTSISVRQEGAQLLVERPDDQLLHPGRRAPVTPEEDRDAAAR